MADLVLGGRAFSWRLGALARFAPLPCALVLALVAATMVGSVSISPAETIHILLHKLGAFGGSASWPQVDEEIIWNLRVPHVIAAALVGAALATAGVLLQAVLRNPLADPYVIGTAAGAQLGVTFALLFPLQLAIAGFGSLQVLSFAGAVGTILFVYGLARTGGRTPVVTLLLAGFVVSSFLISASTFLMMATDRTNDVMTWVMGGGLAVTGLGQLSVTGPMILAAIALTFGLSRRLDLLLLGEEQASHLGVRVEQLKVGAVTLASLLTALAVALAGIIAFVGLVVPHAVRLVYGPSHRFLVPASALAGALFLVVADAAARSALPYTPLPLGVITAVIGAPFFLHLLRRSRREYGI